jgi:hypothetical protein
MRNTPLLHNFDGASGDVSSVLWMKNDLDVISFTTDNGHFGMLDSRARALIFQDAIPAHVRRSVGTIDLRSACSLQYVIIHKQALYSHASVDIHTTVLGGSDGTVRLLDLRRLSTSSDNTLGYEIICIVQSHPRLLGPALQEPLSQSSRTHECRCVHGSINALANMRSAEVISQSVGDIVPLEGRTHTLALFGAPTYTLWSLSCTAHSVMHQRR